MMYIYLNDLSWIYKQKQEREKKERWFWTISYFIYFIHSYFFTVAGEKKDKKDEATEEVKK